MDDEHPRGSYTYPNTSDDPDRQNVLRNKFGIESKSELRTVEYRATQDRISEILEGDGPKGNFDAAHLKAIHGHIFQDVYEWAGHTRNESPVVDGTRLEPIGGLSKGGTSFLHGARIDMGLNEAVKPVSDPQALRAASREEFVERAAKTLSELNYVHPFREGNGRTQETFITELGRHYGHDIDMSVISKTRMIEASIATTHDPASPALKHVVEDAIDPNRREALRGAFADLEQVGEKPFEHYVRTVRPGEEIEGQVFGHDNRVATVVTENGIIAVDRADLPERIPADDEEVKFTARSDFRTLGRPEQEAQPQPQSVEQKAEQAPQQSNHNAELKAVEAQHLATRGQQTDRDDRDR
ncbi:MULTISPECIES: Fic/DOC family protein [Agrobacterium]|uniref:Fic/DOC family protein n=1 Tax=Agrobacterium tumefaciens TaxID=358 RepID=UPI0015718504|nr:Fic family protein [Agrobacterium tumefaciens]WCK22440.1 Fic family protein [Agrobacterium tumefaciens]